jgi:tetrahydromethanopterin S-methyltransferase subunit B
VIIVFLICCFKSILTETKVKIHENEIPDEMKDHAIALAVEGFESNTDLNVIASKISNEFNTLYGNDWYCFIGPIGTVSHFNAMPNTLLRFSSELTQVLLFKPSFVTQKNLISNALRNTTKLTVIKSEMNDEMQKKLLDITLTALKLFNNFESIAKNISDSLDATYGKYWNCFVGHNGTHAYARYINETYISFIVGEIQFVLFQTSQPTQKVNKYKTF